MKIYLACPYSDPSLDVREWRFRHASRAAGDLMRQGYLVFSPTSHTHPIAVEGDLPLGWDFWQAYDRSFIEWADELWVLDIPGWRRSRGVTAEIAIARERGRPVRYYSPDMRKVFDVAEKEATQ